MSAILCLMLITKQKPNSAQNRFFECNNYCSFQLQHNNLLTYAALRKTETSTSSRFLYLTRSLKPFYISSLFYFDHFFIIIIKIFGLRNDKYTYIDAPEIDPSD